MIIVAGTNKSAYITGVTYCKDRCAHLPFFAFADAATVDAELDLIDFETEDGSEDVQLIIDVFDKHGFVIFFDNPTAAKRFMVSTMHTLDIAAATSWDNRTPDPVRKN
jgi:hypothetical protein